MVLVNVEASSSPLCNELSSEREISYASDPSTGNANRYSRVGKNETVTSLLNYGWFDICRDDCTCETGRGLDNGKALLDTLGRFGYDHLPSRGGVKRVDKYRTRRSSNQRCESIVEQLFASGLDLSVLPVRVLDTEIDAASREGVVELVSAQILPKQLESFLGVLVVATKRSECCQQLNVPEQNLAAAISPLRRGLGCVGLPR